MTIKNLRGLGPKSEQRLAHLGITTQADLLKSDPIKLYQQMKLTYPDTSLNMLYAIIGAQENKDWRDIAKYRKTEILMQLDDLGLI